MKLSVSKKDAESVEYATVMNLVRVVFSRTAASTACAHAMCVRRCFGLVVCSQVKASVVRRCRTHCVGSAWKEAKEYVEIAAVVVLSCGPRLP